MEPNVQRIIILPRFTSLAGTGDFLSAPINVREFGSGIFTYSQVAALGTIGPVVTVTVQESPDLEFWDDIGAALSHFDPEEREFRFEWIRLKLTMTGADPGVTNWCVADFVRRHR